MEKNDAAHASQVPSPSSSELGAYQRQSYRGPLRIGGGALALAVAAGSINYASNHHDGQAETGVAVDATPSTSPLPSSVAPDQQPGGETKPTGLAGALENGLEALVPNILALPNQGGGYLSYVRSGDAITMTYRVGDSNSTSSKPSGYSIVVSGKADASGNNIDPSQLTEVDLTEVQGTTAVVSIELDKDPETEDWATTIINGTQEIINGTTDPYGSQEGKQVMDNNMLNTVLKDIDGFTRAVGSSAPVTPLPTLDFQTDLPYPSIDPGLST